MIELQNVSRRYGDIKSGGHGHVMVHALIDVSLTIAQGEYIAIMGPSGSGKSSLMNILGLLDVPSSGTYRLFGVNVGTLQESQLAQLRNRVIGFIFQQFNLLARTPAVVNVALPLLYQNMKNGSGDPRELLTAVGMAERLWHRPSELSGGQQQRVAIARALVNHPAVVFADEPTGNLDSASQEEILRILDGLHDEGVTIILVTHELDVAHRAKRIIRMKDGGIISDESHHKSLSPLRERVGLGPHHREGPLDVRLEAARRAGVRGVIAEPEIRRALLPPPFSQRLLRTGAHLRQAVRALRVNALRTVLSMLGILIGVAAVISMLALGAGAQKSISDSLSAMGTNLLNVRPGSRRTYGVSQEAGAVTRFTMEDVEAIMALGPAIRRVVPNVVGSVQVVFGNKNARTRLAGTLPERQLVSNWKTIVGRFFTQEEVSARARVVVVGTTVAKALFGEQYPVGEMVRIDRVPFTVIGVLESKGASTWSDQDDTVLVPISTAMRRVLGRSHIDNIDVEAASMELVPQVEQALKTLIAERHRVPPSQTDAFEVRNMAEMQAAMTATTRTFSMLLGAIAAVSLLVGGIGIMNIMLVSVTERTREIGLRKAVGARPQDILSQFLIESIVVSVIGGSGGIVLAIIVSTLVARLANWAIIVTPQSVALAFGFSAFVGIVFGIWPARRAARLSPIEALRYE